MIIPIIQTEELYSIGAVEIREVASVEEADTAPVVYLWQSPINGALYAVVPVQVTP